MSSEYRQTLKQIKRFGGGYWDELRKGTIAKYASEAECWKVLVELQSSS